MYKLKTKTSDGGILYYIYKWANKAAAFRNVFLLLLTFVFKY